MTLNKVYAGNVFWATEDYELRAGCDPSDFGYMIVNKNTEVTEMMIDAEPQALMAMMWMQEQYEEVMHDPEREFKVRRNTREPMQQAPKLVQ